MESEIWPDFAWTKANQEIKVMQKSLESSDNI